MKQIIYYKHTNGKVPVVDWIKSLDLSTKKRIINRLARIAENDNFGDYKQIDKDIRELRFKFGSGYRIYYSEFENTVIVLLNAGDKKLQNKDIEKAKEYLNIWRKNNDRI